MGKNLEEFTLKSIHIHLIKLLFFQMLSNYLYLIFCIEVNSYLKIIFGKIYMLCKL